LGFRTEDVRFRARPDTSTFGPRCAEVTLGDESIGLIGEAHPQVRAAWGLPNVRVCIAELKLHPLVRPHWRLEPMRAISNYPLVVEDLAFEVQEDVTARETLDAILRGGGKLIADVELFDVYRGAPLPDNMKSLAYRVIYQSTEAPLSEKEVTQLRQRIVSTVERLTKGKLRAG
jgi:phenylalanyl-tRNA synthetase beta chain